MAAQPTAWSAEPIQLEQPAGGGGLWYFFIPLWVICCGTGAFLAIVGGQTLIGLLIIGMPTVAGIILSPTFAVACIALMLPFGSMIQYEGFLSGDRILGGIAAISIFVHCLATGKGIHAKGSPLVPLFGITLWGVAAIAWASHKEPAFNGALHLLVLCGWGLAIWNTVAYQGGHFWPLRSYVIGMWITVAYLFASGAIYRLAKSEERITLEGTSSAMNPADFAILLGCAFLTSIYLIMRDPARWLRPAWACGSLFFPAVMVQTGSRGPMLALALAMAASLVSFRSFLKSRALMIGSVLMVALFAGGIYWSLNSGFVSKGSMERLTSESQSSKAGSYRLRLALTGIKRIIDRPLTGTGLRNYMLVEQDQHNVVHTEILFLGTELGLPGMAFYIWFVWRLSRRFMKTRSAPEKWYLRSLVILLIVAACAHVTMFRKFFWFFLIFAAGMAHRSSRSEQQDYPYASECKAC